MQIVSKIWALRNAYPLQKFYLNWLYDCDPIHVDKWVSTAITSFLEKLTLNICPHLPFDIPSTLFNYCKTLVDLRLHGNIIVDPPPSSLGFLSLKILHLLGVQYANHDSFSRFLTCCPILEYLCLEVIEMDEECNFIITLPTLKRLDLNMLDFLYKLEINAPALEYLEFVGFLHKVVLLENLSNLVKAVLFVSYDSEVSDTEDYGNRVMDFIRALYSVKSLHLGSYTRGKAHFSFSIINWLNGDIVVLTCDVMLLCSSFAMFLNLILPCFTIWLSLILIFILVYRMCYHSCFNGLLSLQY